MNLDLKMACELNNTHSRNSGPTFGDLSLPQDWLLLIKACWLKHVNSAQGPPSINLVPRAFPLAPGGLLCILIGQ
jgi:hypothetical protein